MAGVAGREEGILNLTLSEVVLRDCVVRAVSKDSLLLPEDPGRAGDDC